MSGSSSRYVRSPNFCVLIQPASPGGRPVSQSVSQSVSQPVSPSVGRSIRQPVRQSVSRSVNSSVGQSVGQFVNLSVNQPLPGPSNCLAAIHQSPTGTQPLTAIYWQPGNQATSQLANQPSIRQSVRPSTAHRREDLPK